MTVQSMAKTGSDDHSAAQRVFRLEAQGIMDLADSLDDRFCQALDKISQVEGRVIVSGMGKSGHIANKIAATLASTGTPAFFVHPAEASHGDLGMITKHDLMLVISNSGETREFSDLFAHSRRYGIPLIAITAGGESFFAKNADVALILPPTDEACPMGLSPTTSTTMALALGDAIAIALLERRGFTTDDYELLHPGGQLGRLLLKVSDIMHGGKGMPLIDADASMADAILEMTEKRLGCVGVTAPDGGLAGVITDGDLRRQMAPGLFEKTAGEAMTASPVTIRPDALVAEAVRIMNEHAITNLFVTGGDEVVGVLHVHDCLRAGIR
jgi:arabinose-5-phosphate isomerase